MSTLRHVSRFAFKAGSEGNRTYRNTDPNEAWILSYLDSFGGGRGFITRALLVAAVTGRGVLLPGMAPGTRFPGGLRTLDNALRRLEDRGMIVRIKTNDGGSLYARVPEARAIPPVEELRIRDVQARGTKIAYWRPNLPGVEAIASIGVFEGEQESIRFAEEANRIRKRWNRSADARLVA